MPVSIIENWALVEGAVARLEAPEDLPEFTGVIMRVDDVQPVEGFPNLLAEAVGSDLRVLIRSEQVRELGVSRGDLLRCRVRKAAGSRVFVHRRHIEKLPRQPSAAEL